MLVGVLAVYNSYWVACSLVVTLASKPLLASLVTCRCIQQPSSTAFGCMGMHVAVWQDCARNYEPC